MNQLIECVDKVRTELLLCCLFTQALQQLTEALRLQRRQPRLSLMKPNLPAQQHTLRQQADELSVQFINLLAQRFKAYVRCHFLAGATNASAGKVALTCLPPCCSYRLYLPF